MTTINPIRAQLKHWLWLAIALVPCLLHGAEININVSLKNVGDKVHVLVHNNSQDPLSLLGVEVELDGAVAKRNSKSIVEPQSSKAVVLDLKRPERPGSYAQVATVRYLNNGKRLSITVLGSVEQTTNGLIEIPHKFPKARLVTQGVLKFAAAEVHLWDMHLPEELSILADKTKGNVRSIELKGTGSGFESNYPIFATRSFVDEKGIHRLAIAKSQLRFNFSEGFKRGAIPDAILWAALLASFALGAFLTLPNKAIGPAATSLTKWSAAVFFATLGYLLLRHGDYALDQMSRALPFEWLNDKLAIARNNLRGSNYSYFFKYVADAYWVAIVVGILPYTYWIDRSVKLEDDKYSAGLKALASLPMAIIKKKKGHWGYVPRLGWLAFAVKLFYIPLLSSWVINNVNHQWNLSNGFDWDPRDIARYLTALFIFVDTTIFGFGYIVESKHLNNKIRSVEPTIVGWVVCLWCYPPFNSWSFTLFDKAIPISMHIPISSEAFDIILLCAVAFGWGIFAWASIALGFKASNLTNRGIVSHGPYRFCRHPAYTSKLIVWGVEAVFFGKYFVGLLLGYIIIYLLRAWTEERHLSQDPEYIEYKKNVPWKLFPGIF